MVVSAKERQLEEIVERLCEVAAEIAGAQRSEFVRMDAMYLMKVGVEYLQLKGRRVPERAYHLYMREYRREP